MSTQNDPNQPTPLEELGRKVGKSVGEAVKNLDQESERVIAYLNAEVVPAIRNKSSKALRTAAEQLSKLAEYMEQHPTK
jgi:Sec-independent protein translocase protein TatA